VTPDESCDWLKAALAEIAKRSLSAHEKLLLFVLVHHAWSSRACFPSYTTLVRETGLCRRVVIYTMNNLVRKRLVDRIVQFNARGDQAENLYRLHLGGGAQHAPGGCTTRTQNRISETSLISGTYSPLEISKTSHPPARPARAPVRDEGGRVARLQIPESWVREARTVFSKAHSPSKPLGRLLDRGFSEEEGLRYLRRAARAPDLPPEDHRAIAVWCSDKRVDAWLETQAKSHVAPNRRRIPPIASTKPLTSSDLAARARAFLLTRPTVARSSSRAAPTLSRN